MMSNLLSSKVDAIVPILPFRERAYHRAAFKLSLLMQEDVLGILTSVEVRLYPGVCVSERVVVTVSMACSLSAILCEETRI